MGRALEAWLSGGDDSLEALFGVLESRWLAEGYADEATEARWYAKAERALARFHGAESSRRARVIGFGSIGFQRCRRVTGDVRSGFPPDASRGELIVRGKSVFSDGEVPG